MGLITIPNRSLVKLCWKRGCYGRLVAGLLGDVAVLAKLKAVAEG